MIPLLLLAAIDLAEVRATAVDFLLDRQENNIEWPYRGVYLVRGSQGLENPIGYRVGGTAIVMQALLTVPSEDARPKIGIRRWSEPAPSWSRPWTILAWLHVFSRPTTSVGGDGVTPLRP